MMDPLKEKHWYRLSVEEILKHFAVDPDMGLTEHDAQGRQKLHGLNVLTKERSDTWIDRIVNQLRSPLAFILLAAGIVTTLLKEYVDATIIFIALIINVAISLYQEGRANRAFERLKSSQEKFATVVRDGAKRRIPAEELVPGDIIILETGMNIPADARIIEASNLEINESVLTGEWIAVSKHVKPISSIVSAPEQKNMLFMGTLVVSGSASAIVVATGSKTMLGAIARSLSSGPEPKTPLQENIARIARFLSYIILVALLIIFILGLIRGESLDQLLLVSIAIAVAAIPEGLPAAVTVVLAIGMEATLKKGGLVRSLLAAETLGSTTTILTDKTGTLTKADMRVARIVTLGTLLLEENAKEKSFVRRKHEAHGDERDAIEFAALASDAFLETTRIATHSTSEFIVRGRPVERAIILAALESGLNQTELLANYPRIDYLPFESQYRAAISLNRLRGIKHCRLYITGAPEYLLARAGSVYLEGRAHQCTPDITAKFERAMREYASQGMRLIAVAYRDVAEERFRETSMTYRDSLVNDLVFVGLILLHDPLRDDVKASIGAALSAGVRVVMVTGDNPETARAIAQEAGIWKEGDRVIEGGDVERMSDAELGKTVRHASVFARVLPEHKLRIARILADMGEVVAMTGDGVNDAPALRAASIGVALGSGTEVAKEASDIVLLNNSFSIIVDAIEEGRRIIDNLRKIVIYLLATSFTEIIAVAGTLVAGMPLPLLPAQILWTNMLSEGFMNFAYAFEPKEEDLMRRNPRISGARTMMSREVMGFIVAIGLSFGTILLLLYAWLLADGMMESEARTIVFVALTLGTTLIAFSLKDLHTPLYAIRFWSNRYLLISLILALGGLLLSLGWKPLSTMLGVEDITFSRMFLPAMGVVVLNLLVVEFAKFIFFDRRMSFARRTERTKAGGVLS